MIADIDHDSTTETVDLFSKYALNQMEYGYKSPLFYHSAPFKWLIDTLIPGFSDNVQNSIINMDVDDGLNGEVLSYKIKMPSFAELGLDISRYTTMVNHGGNDVIYRYNGGQIYTLFKLYPKYGFVSDLDGNSTDYNWVRVYCSIKPDYSDNHLWDILAVGYYNAVCPNIICRGKNSNGGMSSSGGAQMFGAFIRFGKK